MILECSRSARLALIATLLLGAAVLWAQPGDPSPRTFATLAGVPQQVGSDDGAGSDARFYHPFTVAVDGACRVYVADAFNHTIRKITDGAVVTTFAGQTGIPASADGPGAAAGFNNPQGVAADPSGNVYVADTFNYTIRKITPDGVVSTIAGLAGHPGSADGTGPEARFNQTAALAVGPSGTIYVADTFNHTIRRIDRDGVVTTWAGAAGSAGDSNGPRLDARFNHPNGVAVDAEGNVYVGDTSNNRIRMISRDGVVTTIAGSGSVGNADGPAAQAEFNAPRGVAVDPVGNVYVADGYNDAIRLITRDGFVTTLAIGRYPQSADGFDSPFGVAIVQPDTLYVSDTFNHTVRVSGSRRGQCP